MSHRPNNPYRPGSTGAAVWEISADAQHLRRLVLARSRLIPAARLVLALIPASWLVAACRFDAAMSDATGWLLLHVWGRPAAARRARDAAAAYRAIGAKIAAQNRTHGV